MESMSIATDEKRRLMKILNKDPGEREEEDIDEIISLVEDNDFLKQFKDTNKLHNLCRYMTLLQLPVRHTVFEQGDPGDSFFIIYSGRVSVYVQENSSITGTQYMKLVAELNKGKSFGELALIYGAPRSATIITSEPCYFIVLDKNTYESVVKGLQLE